MCVCHVNQVNPCNADIAATVGDDGTLRIWNISYGNQRLLGWHNLGWPARYTHMHTHTYTCIHYFCMNALIYIYVCNVYVSIQQECCLGAQRSVRCRGLV